MTLPRKLLSAEGLRPGRRATEWCPMKAVASKGLPHIVVIGAGFGGLAFCRHFPSRRAQITLIDRQNHHLFQPLLYQVATAGLSAVDIAEPVRSILRKKKNLRVLMRTITRVDLAAKTVHYEGNGDSISYDYLVIASGGATSYFGHPEWEKFAPGLKSLDDALRIRRQVLLNLEKAEMETDPAKQDILTTIVVIGGGPTGVELAGTFAELNRMTLSRDFEHIDPAKSRVILLEYAPRVLGMYSEKLSESARRQLTSLGVDVRTGQKVEDIRDGIVIANGQPLAAGTIIWSAGVSASSLSGTLGVPVDRGGRILGESDLSVPGHRSVFAVGDTVAVKDAEGKPVPGVAPAALQMGKYVARLLEGEIAAGAAGTLPPPRKPFKYVDKGSMATIGRSKAVAKLAGLEFSGWPAWAAWLGVHLIFLVGFRSKLAVLMQWIYSYFTYKRGARVITGTTRPDSTPAMGA